MIYIFIIILIGCANQIFKDKQFIKMHSNDVTQVIGGSSKGKEPAEVSSNDTSQTLVELSDTVLTNSALLFQGSDYEKRRKFYDIIVNNRIEDLSIFVDNNEDFLNVSIDGNGNTAIMVAISCDNSANFKFLIDLKEQKEIKTYSSSGGSSSQGIKKYINFPKVNFNSTNLDGITPLVLAIIEGKEDHVKALLQNGADINKKVKGLYPTAWAARENRVEIVKLLLSKEAGYESRYKTKMKKVVEVTKNSMIAAGDIATSKFSTAPSLLTDINSAIMRRRAETLSDREIEEANARVRYIKHRDLTWILLRDNFNEYGITYVYRRLAGISDIGKIGKNYDKEIEGIIDVMVEQDREEGVNREEDGDGGEGVNREEDGDGGEGANGGEDGDGGEGANGGEDGDGGEGVNREEGGDGGDESKKGKVKEGRIKKIANKCKKVFSKAKNKGSAQVTRKWLEDEINRQAKELGKISKKLEGLQKSYLIINNKDLKNEINLASEYIKNNLYKEGDIKVKKSFSLYDKILKIKEKFKGYQEQQNEKTEDQEKDLGRKLLKNYNLCSRMKVDYPYVVTFYSLGKIKLCKKYFKIFEESAEEAIKNNKDINSDIENLWSLVNKFECLLSEKEASK